MCFFANAMYNFCYKILKVQLNRALPDLPPSPLNPAIPNVYDEVTGEHVFLLIIGCRKNQPAKTECQQ